MIYLTGTVLLNTLLAVLFKLFPRFRIDTLQAIVVNYWVCVGTGSLFTGHFPVTAGSLQAGWAPWALLTGIGFISIFNLLAWCTQVDGITTATVANKLSMVIPALFALYLYGDVLTPGKGLGILLAFPAVYLTTRAPDDGRKKQQLLWPALLFCSSGLLDTLINYVAITFFSHAAGGPATFLIHAFAVAGVSGAVLLGVLLATGKKSFAWRHVAAGVVLGVPNYFSMHYFLRLLQSGFLQSSAAIPVTNIATVLLSAVCALLLFREKARLPRLLGILLSVIAILLILISDLHVRTP